MKQQPESTPGTTGLLSLRSLRQELISKELHTGLSLSDVDLGELQAVDSYSAPLTAPAQLGPPSRGGEYARGGGITNICGWCACALEAGRPALTVGLQARPCHSCA